MQNLSALITVLIISSFSLIYMQAAIKPVVGSKDFNTWTFSWVALTILVFLSPKLIITYVVTVIFLWYAAKKTDNKTALFFAVLFVLPSFTLQTVAINLNFQRSVALALLLPLFLHFKFGRIENKSPRHFADLFFTLYMILYFVLRFRGIYISPDEGFVLTYPAVIKYGISIFLQYFLPYYILSRYITTFDELKKAITAIVFVCILLAPIAVYEIATSGLLYHVIPTNLGLPVEEAVRRAGMVRASASIEHPLYLGMMMMIGLGLYIFVANFIEKPLLKYMGLLIIVSGLLAPLSKGAWLGSLLMLFMFYVSSHNKLKNGVLIVISLTAIVTTLSLFGYGDKVISLLPFVGDVDTGNVDYRAKLLEQSVLVIEDSPWFGTYEPTKHKAMLPLVQGQGIVDIVNLYLGVVLRYGLVGLFLFLSFILVVTTSLFKELFILNDRRNIKFKCGTALFCTMLGFLVQMSVIANTKFPNTVFFAFCGLIISYVNIMKAERNKRTSNVDKYETTRVIQ